MVGTLAGLSLTLWIGIGYQVASHSGLIIFEKLPVNTCNFSEIAEVIENALENEYAEEELYSRTAAAALIQQKLVKHLNQLFFF